MDNKQLTDKQRKLIIDNYKLLLDFINKTLDKKVVPKYLEDDFISDMFLKFCISALKFKKDSGFKFSTYVYRGFDFGLTDIITRKKIRFKKLFHNEDIYKSQIEYKEHWLQGDLLCEFISSINLDSEEQSMIEDYYYEELSLKATGQKHNITGEAVRQSIKKSLKKIRFNMSKKELSLEDFYK